MADKEKLKEERKTGGPKMLRPGLGQQARKKKTPKAGIGNLPGKKKKQGNVIIIGENKKYSTGQGGIERDANDNPYRYSYDADPMLKNKNVVFMKPMAKGGRAGFKSGSKGCKLAMKGKGRAYGKNS